MKLAGFRTRFRQNHTDGAQDDLEIKPDIPVVSVRHNQRDIAGERRIPTGLHLPQASDAWGHVEAAQMAELVFLHLVGKGRTGADNAHLAAQNIEELRQFV
jgi:hypothetical protein